MSSLRFLPLAGHLASSDSFLNLGLGFAASSHISSPPLASLHGYTGKGWQR